MAQEPCVLDFKAFYTAPLATAFPARPWTSITDFVAAGFTKMPEPDGNEGAILTFIGTAVDKRPAGTKMRTSQEFSEIGLDTIALRSYNSDDPALLLAFPDITHDGASTTGGGETQYYRAILVTDNNAWAAKKVSPSGNVAVSATNSEFGFTPYELRAFEDDDNDPAGTSNYFVEPLLS